MTFTIWSNGGKFEWIIRDDDSIVKRSGLVFSTRTAAKRDMVKNACSSGDRTFSSLTLQR